MSGSPIIQINVKKTHLIAIAILLLIATATSTVNIRDELSVFQDLNMNENSVTNATEYRFTESFVREYDADNDGEIEIGELGQAGQDYAGGELSLRKLGTIGEYYQSDIPVSGGLKAAPLTEDGKILASGAYTGTKSGTAPAGNFTFSSDINLQNNNIYNAGNLENAGNSGGGLDWSTARQVKDSYEDDGNYNEASVTCDSDEVLVEASCHKNYDSDGTDVLCDTRTERKAEIVDGDTTGETVWGTCVDKVDGSWGGSGGSSDGVVDGSNLNWYKCADSDSDEASCSISCPADENLVAEAYSSQASSSQPGWYDTWLKIDSSFSDEGSFGSHVYGSGRVMARGGTAGDGISLNRYGGSGTSGYVTAVVACAP